MGRQARGTTDAVATVTGRLRAAAKYRSVHPDTIADVVRRESDDGAGAADLERRARARLHRVAALHLFTARSSVLRRAGEADGAPAADVSQVRDRCRVLLGGHVSTAERLPDLDVFYGVVLDTVPAPSRIVDVACALNVFTLPWLRDVTAAEYVGYDLNTDVVAAGSAFLAAHHPDCRMVHGDVLTGPTAPADVALLLKTYHCMEDRRRGAGLELVDRLDAGHVVVSFPTRAMNGRAAVFVRRHVAALEELAERSGWTTSRAAVPSEEFVVLHKR